MNFHFPDRRALCMAENATHNLHNLLTLRGAVVRDAADLVALPRRGDRRCSPTDTDVAFASHHWPTWGPRTWSRVPDRAARPVRLPARPDAAPAEPGPHRHARSPRRSSCRRRWTPPGTRTATTARSATTSRPIYQRYLGWFDGNPAHLWQHPPRGRGRPLRRDASAASTPLLAKAQEYADAGDLRFAAELLNHAVFAEPDHDAAKAAAGRRVRPARVRRRERAPGATST